MNKFVFLVQVEIKKDEMKTRHSFIMNSDNEIRTLKKHLKNFGGRVISEQPHPVSDWVAAMDTVEDIYEGFDALR